ncbi:hypothetical protein [Rhizobium rhizoryzae]|uniref:hypothetical protein n=1 Tax=Rhizobium rhizoryzae TaxID=451876 RepID=UPI0028ACA5FE|nr:hypothetical protein [Rhizobium rhizoryzae]
MTLFRYAIVRVNRHWQIVSDRKRIGLFLTAYQAAKTAAGLAREAQQSGHEVEIAVQQAGGELVKVALPVPARARTTGRGSARLGRAPPPACDRYYADAD